MCERERERVCVLIEREREWCVLWCVCVCVERGQILKEQQRSVGQGSQEQV